MQVSLNNYSPSFGVKINTVSMFEATTGKVFGDNGIKGFKEVIDAFPEYMGNRCAAGNRGYVYYAKQIGEAIAQEYPAVANTTEKILEVLKQHPHAKNKELQQHIYPLIKDFGEVFDVVL